MLVPVVPEPAGFAFLSQEIEPDDYRGRTVTFRGELRTAVASAPKDASRCSRAKASWVAARPADMRVDSDAMRQA